MRTAWETFGRLLLLLLLRKKNKNEKDQEVRVELDVTAIKTDGERVAFAVVADVDVVGRFDAEVVVEKQFHCVSYSN